jgi:hypothetical protein
MQVLSQVPVQLASIDPLQLPLQLASRSAEHWSWKFGAVHCVLQSADAARLQVVPASRSMPPQSLRTIAWAVRGNKATRAPKVDAATAAKNLRENMEGLLLTIVSQGPPGVEPGRPRAQAHGSPAAISTS